MPSLDILASRRENPTRPVVDIAEFERINSYRKQIKEARTLLSAPQDKVAVAQIIESYVVKPDSPNEVKLEAMRDVINLIDSPDEAEINQQIAMTAIDMIRAQKDSSIGLLMVSRMCLDIEDRFMYPAKKPETTEEAIKRAYRKSAFESLARGATVQKTDKGWKTVGSSVPEVYRNWADKVLKPSSRLQEFYRNFKWDELHETPDVIEEITEEFSEIEAPEDASIAAAIVRLPNRAMPTLDKMAEYEVTYGEPLPLYIVWKEGRNFHSIRFPRDLSLKAQDLWLRFRAGEIPREQVFEDAKKLEAEYLSRLNPAQREEVEQKRNTHNLELRFSTSRGDLKEIGGTQIQTTEQGVESKKDVA